MRNRTGLVYSHAKANLAQSARVATTGLFLLLASNSKGLTASSLQDTEEYGDGASAGKRPPPSLSFFSNHMPAKPQRDGLSVLKTVEDDTWLWKVLLG